MSMQGILKQFYLFIFVPVPTLKIPIKNIFFLFK